MAARNSFFRCGSITAGVMPVIFAQSIMLFPSVALGWLHNHLNTPGESSGSLANFVSWLNDKMGPGKLIYVLVEIGMIYFFAYFWTTVQFQPKEMAKQLQDYGSFVPGIRPGPRTAQYLENVMYRITFRRRRLPVPDRSPPDHHRDRDEDSLHRRQLPGRHRPADRHQRCSRRRSTHRGQPHDAELWRIPRRRWQTHPRAELLNGAKGRGQGAHAEEDHLFFLAPLPLTPSTLPPMPIILKSRSEIEMMRRTGAVGRAILDKMAAAVIPGVTTAALNDIARVELERVGAIATSKNYPTYKLGEGYPAETCISVNDEVVHGIPSDRPLKVGDVVSLDLALKHQGFCADMAITVPVGQVTPANTKLLDVTRKTLDLALRLIRPNARWSEIARQMQRMVESNGFQRRPGVSSGTASGDRCTRIRRSRTS